MVLARALLAEGLPESRLHVLLDEQASLKAIEAEIKKIGERSKSGESLLVYYTGHGTREGDEVHFYPYDSEPKKGLTTSDLGSMLASSFKGDRAILTADCCFSGGLDQTAAILRRQGLSSAVLASASPTEPSGPTWAFTMTLTDCLQGKRPPDRDLDHRVTLEEAILEIREVLAFTQRQESYAQLEGLNPSFVLSYVTSIETVPRLPKPYEGFQFVRFRREDRNQGGRLMGFLNDQFLLRLQRYSDRPIVSAKEEQISANPPQPDADLTETDPTLGRYEKLLRKIRVESDYLDFPSGFDFGLRRVEVYGQHDQLPPGYWVYVYPYWYIWETKRSPG